MADPRFFNRSGPFTVGQLAEQIEVKAADETLKLVDVAALDKAGPDMLGFFSNPKLADRLTASRAGAVLIKAEHADLCPPSAHPLICADPYRTMARAAQIFYPEAAQSRPMPGDLQGGHMVHPQAKIGRNVSIAPNVVIGPDVEIGDGCSIGASAVIGHGVALGRDCTIGAHVSIGYALLGDRVIVHGGAMIGGDGFGFAPGSAHIKIPQLGRVIVQADVEIGANATIDRGALGDTNIGEGTKLDNLVHIAHNVQLGRHCFLAAFCGIAGSATLGDYVQMGGQSGVGGHLSIGNHVVIAANATVLRSVAEGGAVAGTPARDRASLYRDQAFVSRLRRQSAKNRGSD